MSVRKSMRFVDMINDARENVLTHVWRSERFRPVRGEFLHAPGAEALNAHLAEIAKKKRRLKHIDNRRLIGIRTVIRNFEMKYHYWISKGVITPVEMHRLSSMYASQACPCWGDPIKDRRRKKHPEQIGEATAAEFVNRLGE